MAANSQEQAGMITMDQAAKLLMVSPEWIRRLCKAGYIPRVAKGKYPLVGVVQGYIKSLKDEEKKASKGASESRVRDARAAEIERRMAREDLKIVDIDEATATYEDMIGELLKMVNSLPAQITRNPSERRRIEDIIGKAQGRFVARASEIISLLETGGKAAYAEDEDDA